MIKEHLLLPPRVWQEFHLWERKFSPKAKDILAEDMVRSGDMSHLVQSWSPGSISIAAWCSERQVFSCACSSSSGVVVGLVSGFHEPRLSGEVGFPQILGTASCHYQCYGHLLLKVLRYSQNTVMCFVCSICTICVYSSVFSVFLWPLDCKLCENRGHCALFTSVYPARLAYS